jgi:hypothetical protein
MNNTVVTSVSALVFLVIGLFIGKSNNPIQIKTIVKTNVVEKPAIEYVDKYITNVVEKVVEAEITHKHKFALEIHQRILNASVLDFDKLPIGIDELKIEVLIDKKYEDQINPKQITELLEFEARKIGIKINEESKNKLFYAIDILQLDNNSQYVYTGRLSFYTYSLLFATPDKTYRFTPEVWSKGSFGILGKNNFNQKYFNEKASTKMVSFCNRILETREK